MQSPFNWSEIDGITHIIFLPCSFAIRDIFLFAHYGFLQVRQVCRIAANLRTLALSLRSNAVYATSFAPNSRKQRLIALFGAKLTVSLTLSFFPVRSLFVIFSFLLTMAPFKFVRFAHGANLRTLALSLRSNAVYATSFAPNSRKQRLIALFGAKLTVSLTLSFFPVRSLFVIFSFLLTMAPFKFVRFAHGANLRTLALSLRSITGQ